jgi:small-conductance mechanosensitive channel
MVKAMKIRILLTLFLFLISAVQGYSYTTAQAAPDTSVTIEAIIDTEQEQESEEPASDEAGSEQEDTKSGLNEAADEVKSDVAQIRELISFNKVFYSLLLLFITYFVNKYLTIIIDSISEKTTNYRLFIKRLAPISRILIWSFAIYVVIAGIIVPPFETVITIAASIGIAVGFASQDILRNIFGGVMIILDRPFQVGDKIQVGDHYGEVLSIGLRSSRVVTPDDSIVSLPNGELMNRAVSNANSSALDCQVVAEIFLPATVDIQQVKQIAFKAVYASSYTYLNKPVDVIVLNEMHNRQYVVKLRVKAYVVDIRYEFLFKSDMTEMILNECNRLGYIPKNGVEQTEATERS